MPDPAKLSWRNLIDNAALTASAELPTLPALNLATTDINQVWRTQLSESAAWIVADLGAQHEVGYVMLANTNIGLSTEVQVRLSTGDATGAAGDAYNSGTFTAGVNPAWRLFLHFFEATGQFLRIDMTVDQPEAGRMAAGPIWTPSKTYALGWEPLWQDHSIHSRSLGLVQYIDRRKRQRGFRLRFLDLSLEEAEEQVTEINRQRGTSQDILVCRDPGHSDLGYTTIWGMLGNVLTYPQPQPDFHEVDLECWERL